MTLPLSRIALALALAATATLGVVAQTPDEPAANAEKAVETAVETASDTAPPADPAPPVDTPAEAVAEAAVETEAPADVPAAEPVAEVTEPAPVTEAEIAEVTEVPEEPTAPAEAPAVEESVVVNSAEPAVPVEVVVEAAPAPAGPVCCPLHVVDYRTTLSAKRAYRCYGPGVNTAVCVDNPADCTCTQYQVDLCVPACCTGAPRVCPSTGLFGRGKVDLVWDCGFTATVVFRAHGGAIVIYQG